MNTLKNHVLATAALVLLFVSCVGDKARDHALIPAMRAAWPGVKADVSLGITDSVAQGILTDPEAAMIEVATMDRGLEEKDRTIILSVRWPAMRQYGERGVESRVSHGEVARGVADSLRERLKNFDEAWTKLGSVPMEGD